MNRRLTPLPLAFGVLMMAAVFSARGEWPWRRLTEVPVALPIVVTDPYLIVDDTLHSGETVSTVLARQGISGFDFGKLADLLRFDTRRLRAGLAFKVHRDPTTDQATRIEFRPDPAQRLRFIRTSAGWTGESVPIRWSTDTIRISTVIETSLHNAIHREVSEATLNESERVRLTVAIADVNEWSVDFSRDPQPGDPVRAVVERLVSEDGEVRFGRVLATALSIGGREHEAYNYRAGNGKDGFYDGEGKALRREFLVAPLEFRYITSSPSTRRFHPVLKIYRKHDGTDYSASTGTKVRATANGTIVRAGRAGGYGNLVEIRHRNGITTRYAHLNGFAAGIRSGRSVSQGELIGYVGSTGNSTGPHLHYEFRVNGVPKDPRSIKTEAGEPLDPSDLPGFRNHRDVLARMLGQTAPSQTLTD